MMVVVLILVMKWDVNAGSGLSGIQRQGTYLLNGRDRSLTMIPKRGWP